MTFPEIEFSKIENDTIFQHDFFPFDTNNRISFSSNGIAVLYGPNGTGKSSLAKVLAGKKGTSVAFIYNGTEYTDASQIFHVISDQNNRNIISGHTKDFLLGDNIKREFELEDIVNTLYSKIIENIRAQLKTDFSISTKSNELISLIEVPSLRNIISDFVNNQAKGKNILIDEFITVVDSLPSQQMDSDFSEDKWKFFVSQYPTKTSLLRKILDLKQPDLIKVDCADKLEKDSVAIDVLKKFPDSTSCIVCDYEGINPEILASKKEEHRQMIIDSLTKQLKIVATEIEKLTDNDDPFGIKYSIYEAMNSGDFSVILKLQSDIKSYFKYFNIKLCNIIINNEDFATLKYNSDEYKKITSTDPVFSHEDLIYLQEIVENSMHKKIKIERDSKRHLKLLLEKTEFIEKERDELPLSAGEQNFLSLSFELLKAKNSDKPVIVLDDPISSFDSIYKNKIIYSIVKVLEGKSRIILTHNTDMIRLLESQYNHSFNLYILNNTPDEENGFIRISVNEQKMLINITALLDTFRKNIFGHIEDTEMYLLSMIPFMRGYASIKGDCKCVEELTELMHGYKTQKVDLVKIYLSLFGDMGKDFLPTSLVVDVNDIIRKSVDTITIVNTKIYPTLNKTLQHSFTYLLLRLFVEQTLVKKYDIDTTKYNKLGSIIDKAFPKSDVKNMRKRIRLTSKKTLINEFNHFEGNLSIFQPAIDITDRALSEEKSAIISLMNSIDKDEETDE